jgi:DNA-directed RNA polymerase beta subunit
MAHDNVKGVSVGKVKPKKLLEKSPKFVREVIGFVEEIEDVKEIQLSPMRMNKKGQKGIVTCIQLTVKQKKRHVRCRIYHPCGDIYSFEVLPDTDKVFLAIQKLSKEL